MSDPKIVLNFWFNEIEPAQWWRKDPAFDAQLKQRFGQLHEDVAHTGALHWRDHATGRLAEVIVLDQFSRNLYRDDPRAFTWDAPAHARGWIFGDSISHFPCGLARATHRQPM